VCSRLRPAAQRSLARSRRSRALMTSAPGQPLYDTDDQEASRFAAFDAAWAKQYIGKTLGFRYGATVVFLTDKGVQHRREFGRIKHDTVFVCHSMTKMVTTIACLQVRDRGLLSLDDPVSKHLPSFLAGRPLDDRTSPLPRTQAKSTITIRHCLNHTSGLSYYWMDPPTVRSPAEKGLESAAKIAGGQGTRMDFLSTSLALFEAGEHWQYASAHNIIAAIIEKVSGQSIEDFFQENIFKPLGMVDTTFVPSAAQRARMAKKMPVNTGVFKPYVGACMRAMMPRIIWFPIDDVLTKEQAKGDGGLKGTASDWARLNLMLLNGGELDGVRVLSEESVTEMSSSSVDGKLLEPPFSFQGGVADEASRGPVTKPSFRVDSATKCRGANIYPGQTMGLGVTVVQDPAKAELVPNARGYAGWEGIASTFFGYNPKAKVGVLVMGQQMFPSGAGVTRSFAYRDAINAAHEQFA